MASEQFRIDLLAPTVIKYAQQDKHILDGVTLPNKTRSLIIVHVGPDRNQGHWILVTFENGTAYARDSYSGSYICDELIRSVRMVYGPHTNIPIPIRSRTLQRNNTDCGVLAIAYSVDFLMGIDPREIEYDYARMRPHIVEMIRTGIITPFPRAQVHMIGNIINTGHTTSNTKPVINTTANKAKTRPEETIGNKRLNQESESKVRRTPSRVPSSCDSDRTIKENVRHKRRDIEAQPNIPRTRSRVASSWESDKKPQENIGLKKCNKEPEPKICRTHSREASSAESDISQLSDAYRKCPKANSVLSQEEISSNKCKGHGHTMPCKTKQNRTTNDNKLQNDLVSSEDEMPKKRKCAKPNFNFSTQDSSQNTSLDNTSKNLSNDNLNKTSNKGDKSMSKKRNSVKSNKILSSQDSSGNISVEKMTTKRGEKKSKKATCHNQKSRPTKRKCMKPNFNFSEDESSNTTSLEMSYNSEISEMSNTCHGTNADYMEINWPFNEEQNNRIMFGGQLTCYDINAFRVLMAKQFELPSINPVILKNALIHNNFKNIPRLNADTKSYLIIHTGPNESNGH